MTTANTEYADQGLGALWTDKGNLPLRSIEAAVNITGLVGRVVLSQGFHNPHDVPLEATFIFPLPDRSAVTAMRMTAAGRVIEAELKERGQARQEYDQAITEGRRASIAEEERPDVFTMRVGNILPGEEVSVALTLVGPLSYEAGEATFRLPLVVAPRYIPGTPLPGTSVGDGHALDTDAVPDASRITPPVLLPGFPHPVRLSIEVDIDPAGLVLGEVTSSLHAVTGEANHLSIRPGERADRDFILRVRYGRAEDASHALTLTPDADGAEGTFRLTVLPPTTAVAPRPRDVVLLLDRSGSMGGWKMVAARRAAARIVDSLTSADRFTVLTFDHQVEHPPSLPLALVAATDRNRFRAVEHLAGVDARGGTELLGPLVQALGLLNGSTMDGPVLDGSVAGQAGRQRALVLVTDGQVGNEDQILAGLASSVGEIRVHTVGIDRAVNAGFLGRLAAAGGGRCELVESEDRLDDAMDRIHRRIGAPVVSGLTLTATDLSIVDGTVTPARLPDLYPGVALVVTGRYDRAGAPSVALVGRARDGSAWSARVEASSQEASGRAVSGREVSDARDAVTSTWARAYLRELEDRYAVDGGEDLERRIVAVSLRFGVLCRFTAWLAVDTRVATDGGPVHRVIQPVEPVSGWQDEKMRSVGFASPASAAVLMVAADMAAPGGYGASGPGARRSRAKLAKAEPPARAQAPAPMPASAPSEGGSGRDASAGHDAAASIRNQAAVEAGRLRAAQDAPEYERRELLADLGTRLDALVRGSALADQERARALLAELRDDRPLTVPADAFAQLWSRTLDLLDALAAPGRTAFWKRRG